MAGERLQRTLAVQPTVASLPSSKEIFSTVEGGEAITAVGDIARTFVSEKKKSDLETGLRELGGEVFAARQGKQLEDVSERFTRLQQAKEQGVISDTMISIETEKILKESIGSMPGFGPELRQEASRILGFDPTGSEVRALLGVGQDKRPKTFEDQMREKAEFVSNNTGIPVDDVLGIFAKSQFTDTQVKLAENSLKFGSITRSQYLNQSLESSENFVMDAVAEVQGAISQGGVVDPQQFKSRILEQKNNHWNSYRRGLNNSGVFPTSTELSDDRRAFDAQYSELVQMAEDGSLQSILATKSTAVASLSKLEGVKLFPEIAVMNAVGGVPLVESYLNALTGIQSEAQLKLIEKIDPGLALAFGADRSKAFNAFTAGYKQIMGVPITTESAGVLGATQNVEVPESVEDVLTAQLVQTESDEEVRKTVLQRLEQRGKSFKSFSFYSQPGVRARATDEEVQYIKDRWATEFEPLIGRLAISLEERGVELVVTEGGKLIARVTQEELRKRRLTPISSGAHVNKPIRDDVARLDSMVKLLDSGWAGDIGESPTEFRQRTINKIDVLQNTSTTVTNTEELQSALEAFNESPTEDSLNLLRDLDPDLVAEAERRALHRSTAVGDTSGNSSDKK